MWPLERQHQNQAERALTLYCVEFLECGPIILNLDEQQYSKISGTACSQWLITFETTKGVERCSQARAECTNQHKLHLKSNKFLSLATSRKYSLS